MDTAAITALGAQLAQPYKRGPQCLVGTMLDFMREREDPDTVAALLVSLDDPRVEVWRLAALLRENEYDIPAQTLRRHRRRLIGQGCRCPQ